ncbi:hypothetical membrane protein [Candidatus Protochlamydia naegleriophila]|uniref:Hypothetical membrane protein n=2 Tax=Candidatus Protochlamydia naegleriophila TaxID=389348 RepID=A0A0U5ERA9_9BACT|nr:hypothetical membrane protein [Candidatus Protochlamydia naegleriophila]
MHTLDALNAKFGKNTIFFGAMGTDLSGKPAKTGALLTISAVGILWLLLWQIKDSHQPSG